MTRPSLMESVLVKANQGREKQQTNKPEIPEMATKKSLLTIFRKVQVAKKWLKYGSLEKSLSET